jgi:hypothetical protein
MNKRIRKFAITMAIAFSLFGALLFFYFEKTTAGHVLWGLAGSMLVLGIPYPPLLWPFERAWFYFAFALGWINMRILLSAVFYTMFVPVGLFMKLIGRDALERKLDRSAETYWKERPQEPVDPESYERQY